MAENMKGPDRVRLGPRIYRVIDEITVDQHLWIVGKRHQAGLGELVSGPDENPDQFVERILGELAASGIATKLLGGLLIPEALPDSAWTPAMAEETSVFIGKLREPEDFKTVRMLIASLLVGFFANGMVSVRSSATASDSGRDRGLPGANGEPSVLGNGTRL